MKNDRTPTKKKKDIHFASGYDLYSDKKPSDTVRIKYKTVTDIKDTIKHTEKLYKEGKITHVRNFQIYNVMVQRLRVIKEKYGHNQKLNIEARYNLAQKHLEKIKKRTKNKA